MSSPAWKEVAKRVADSKLEGKPHPIDQVAMYQAERAFYTKHYGEHDPKAGPLSKYLLGERLAALEHKGIFYRPINRLLFHSTAKRLETGYFEYIAEELKNVMIAYEPEDLDMAVLAPVMSLLVFLSLIAVPGYPIMGEGWRAN